MPFKYTDVSKLQSAAETLRDRMRATCYSERFTEQDYLDLFVHPVLHEPVMKVNECFDLGRASKVFYTAIDGVKTTIHLTSSHGLPVPREAKVLETAPPETVERLRALVNKLNTIDEEYGTVTKVLKEFAELKLSHSAAAYCLQGLKALAAMRSDEWPAGTIQAFNTLPNRPPSLDIKVRRMCGVAARFIATAQLIPEDISMTWDSYFTVSVY